jgi:hypothetical protein
VLHSAKTLVSLFVRSIAGSKGWLFLINNQKEKRGDSATQKFAEPIDLVRQVSDWGSGVAIKMARRQGGASRTGTTKEHI